MKKKIFAIGAVLIVLISGGVYCMTKWIEHQNSPYNVSDVLDDKGVKLYKRGFRLLEEQLATYIKEHYSGVSKIEFSPIFVQGGDGQTMFDANIVPVIYDNHGNKAYLGRKVGKHGYASYGLLGDIRLDFNGWDEEIIELKVGDDFIDISESKKLPEEVKLSTKPKMDENIEALVQDHQLVDVKKSENGSPDAEINYNTDIKKGDRYKWR
ncbi:hypothetical protein [Streptococcus gordonii]|uniref:hypothetical protein n=1 Tax=Streptococcus gordonii TaxID=1302 RepID=UPI001CC11708|nr:hypothetical protein [Streptococcus gordonii]MBZ2115795.1 hypothetical protein [Streptococcus gordonii]